MATADSKPISPPKPSRSRRRAFTLVELLVATTISGFVLAGIITASFQLMRSAVRVTHYAEMDAHVRRGLEQLSLDLRAATAFTYNGASDITVTVAQADGTSVVYTYAWNSTNRALYRVPGNSSSSQSHRLWLMSGVSALSFSRFNKSGSSTNSDSATKSVGVSLTIARTAMGGADATSKVGASFMLRNKASS